MALFSRKRQGRGGLGLQEDREFALAGTPLTIGGLLRERREDHGMTVGAVAAALRIRPAFIEAMEEDQYDQLPGAAYALGFVRSYADYLGLDGEAMARRFKEEARGIEGRQDLSFPMPLPERGIPGGAILLVALIVAGCVYGVWYYRNAIETTRPEQVAAVPADLLPKAPPASAATAVAPTATASIPAPAAPTAAAPAGATSSTAPSPTPATTPSPLASAEPGIAAEPTLPPLPSEPAATAAPPAAEPASPTPPVAAAAAAPGSTASAPPPAPVVATAATASPGVPTPPAAESQAPAPPPAPAAPPQLTPPAASTADAIPEPPPAPPPVEAPRVFGATSGPVRIILKATADSWIQVRDAKEKVISMRILRTGEIYRVPDLPGLTLRTGNAGGLEITVDGKPVPAIGPSGKTRNVVLDPSRLAAGKAGEG